jgi:hypothetical protein
VNYDSLTIGYADSKNNPTFFPESSDSLSGSVIGVTVFSIFFGIGGAVLTFLGVKKEKNEEL